MSVGKVCEFDMATGAWSSYVERLEMYFKVNGIKSEMKLPTLIAVMGDRAYELLVNLSSPKKPSELDYERAVELLRNHLQPAPSALAERYRFRQRRQGAEENIANYVAELRKLSRYCKFEAGLCDNLRDQFVCGLKSDVMRQRLFTEDDALTFDNAVKIASALEAAERDSAAVDAAGAAGPTRGPPGAGDVHAVAVMSSSGQRERSGARGGRRPRPGEHGPPRPSSGGPGNGPRRSYSGGPSRNCTGCGATDHDYEMCRFRGYECSRCGRVGHLRRVCSGRGKGARWNGQSKMHFNEAGSQESSEEEQGAIDEDFHHLSLNNYKPVSLAVSVDGRVIDMEVDTGSAVTCISKNTYCRYFSHLKLEDTKVRFKFYDGSVVQPLGMILVKVSYKDRNKMLEMFVIENGTTSLMGRQWLSELSIEIPTLTSCLMLDNQQGHLDDNIQMLLSRYEDLFDGSLGRFTGGKATLTLRDGAVPVFHRARPLPYALRDRVDAELDRMLRDGVIEPVECSDWASPLVPVNKSDGSLRICADYKATVNPVLHVDRYPLPKIDDLLVRLGNAKYFSKIDLSQAYNQIELDDTKKYTVINTHRGLFRYNRLVYGLSSSAGIFQRTMCNLLKSIPNVEVFLDDVVIGGSSKAEHLAALESVFKKLCQSGLKLKSKKCVFLVSEVQYLGYVLSKDGIKTDPSKVEAITKIPRPSNVPELRSFIGLVNFYARFVKDMSSTLVPLYELLKKGKVWFWSAECERSFSEIKQLLISAEVLVHYDIDKPVILTCDASARGVGAVLSQKAEDGRGERPVAYVSRTLNDAEKNYSQIHREALAIIFGVQKFHQYLYGRRFLLRTDHKPLVSIFGSHTGIPTMVASRMQRWAIILSAYSFDIEYVRTDRNGADGLSRLPVHKHLAMTNRLPEQTYLHFVQQALLLDYNEVKRQTTRDQLLGRVLSYIRDGWPEECEIGALQPFFNRKNELYEELGCVLWGHRLVVPESCRDKVLGMLHEPHMGIVKSKAMARSYVWWPGIDEAVERMCRECAECAALADAPPRQAPSMWPWPNQPWTRLHLDFMGPLFGKTYLVVVDAMSKWVEIFHMTSTTGGAVVDKLIELFSRWGLPKQVVTDNGPQFTGVELDNFFVSNGIKHIYTAPYHPASNGLAENAVKSLKRVIKKAVLGKVDVNKSVYTYLLHYRNTPHSTTGQSPSALLLGRHLRTKLDGLKPDRAGVVGESQHRQKEAAEGAHRSVEQGQEVWYRQYLKGEKWGPGRIVERTGKNNYRVENDRGEIVHRHIDQLKKKSLRQSLACPNLEGGNRQCTDSVIGGEPSGSLPETPRSEHSPGQRARQSVTRSPGSPASSDGSGAGSPVSPEFEDALPTVSIPVRPVRECRLRNVPRYKY